jgi:hypothetical protein
MAKADKDFHKGDKLHVEIVRANWDRLKSHIDSYNADPKRMTPRLKPADAINAALVEFFKKESKTHAKTRK